MIGVFIESQKIAAVVLEPFWEKQSLTDMVGKAEESTN